MSNPTMLVLAPLSADQCKQWAAPFSELLTEVAKSEAVTGGLESWSGSDAFLTDEVQDLFWSATSDWSFLVELSGEIAPGDPGAEILVVRKLAPMAVLLPGLGWDRARRLPGLAGLWLLDPAEVRAVAAEVEQVFALSQPERATVKERMAQALLLGDEPDLDLNHLLEIVPRTFATAAETGMGIVSCSAVVE